jgi:hypothetical protein
MSAFLQYAFGFPTFIFGALLLFMLLYWLIAMLGLLEVDSLDHSLRFDGSDHAHGVEHSASALAGLLLKVGLGGIPLTVILTALFLLSWLASYVLCHFVPMPQGWTLVNLLTGTLVAVAAAVLGFAATVLVLRPLRGIVNKVAPAEEPKVLLGRTGLVRSAVVDGTCRCARPSAHWAGAPRSCSSSTCPSTTPGAWSARPSSTAPSCRASSRNFQEFLPIRSH